MKAKILSISALLFIVFYLALPFSLRAQSYATDRFGIGSGGTSRGGNYSLSSTIGQAGATAAMSGGSFSVSSGFWSLAGGTNTPVGPGLTMTPSSALTSSGRTGGPFSPPSQNYVLSNAGSNTLAWTAIASTNWLSPSPAVGTLAPGSNVTVIVSINANANGLPGGVYSGSVSFINTTTGVGNTARQVSLTVYTGLNVSGYGLDAAGPVGGPFSPDSTDYQLGNLGNSPMSWAVTYAPVWLSLSQTSGTLSGHASTTVTLTINTTANGFSAGDYSDIVYFTNITDGVGSQFQYVGLVVTNSLKPVISVQPNHYTISPGATVAFSVSASGNAPLYYRWQHSNSNLSGATASRLIISNASAVQSGHYAAVVSNSWGSVTSSFGTLALFNFDHLAPPTLKITAAIGDRYRVDFANRPDTNTWTLLNYCTLTNNPYSVFDANLPSPNARFYRAVYSP